jgi:hypothetical protein
MVVGSSPFGGMGGWCVNPDLAAVLSGERQWCVIHGDNLEVMHSMPDKCVVGVTDPPYGIGKNIAGDKMPWPQWLEWFDCRTIELTRVARIAFQFFASTRLVRFIRETVIPPQFEICWHKPMMLHGTSLNGSPFLAHRESILYWGPTSPREAGKLGYDSVAFNAMWPRERRAEGIEHPTPKPVELLAKCLTYWSRPDDVIFDPYCGSGSHLVAALRVGRRCIGVDIDERWVRDSIERLTAEEKSSSVMSLRDGQIPIFGGTP